MKRNIFQLLAILFVLFFSGAIDQTTDLNITGDATDDIIEEDFGYLDVLEYGIESEVVELLNTLSTDISAKLFGLLEKRYEKSSLSATKVAFSQYFSQCKQIPVEILDKLYRDANSENTDRQLRIKLFYTLAKHGGEREGRFLIEKLDDYDKLVTKAASDALSRMKEAVIVEPVIDRLKLSDTSDDKFLPVEIKSNLVLALGEFNSTQSIPYLREIVKDNTNHKTMIMYAMYSLAKLGDTESVNIINDKLNSNQVKIQEYAAYAISTFKDPAVIPVLSKMFLHNNAKVRVYACKGAVLNQDLSSIPVLKYKFKKDPADAVRKEALLSLNYFGEAGIKELKKLATKEKANPYFLAVISEAVARQPDEVNVGFLTGLYKDANKRNKELIAKTVVKSSSNKIDPVFALLLESSDYLIRIGTIQAVYRLEDSGLWGKVEELSKNDPVKSVRDIAKKMLNLKAFK